MTDTLFSRYCFRKNAMIYIVIIRVCTTYLYKAKCRIFLLFLKVKNIYFKICSDWKCKNSAAETIRREKIMKEQIHSSHIVQLLYLYNYMYDARIMTVRIMIYLYKLILRGRGPGSIFYHKLNYLHEWNILYMKKLKQVWWNRGLCFTWNNLTHRPCH